jgi:hypothetical protein
MYLGGRYPVPINSNPIVMLKDLPQKANGGQLGVASALTASLTSPPLPHRPFCVQMPWLCFFWSSDLSLLFCSESSSESPSKYKNRFVTNVIGVCVWACPCVGVSVCGLFKWSFCRRRFCGGTSGSATDGSSQTLWTNRSLHPAAWKNTASFLEPLGMSRIEVTYIVTVRQRDSVTVTICRKVRREHMRSEKVLL